MIIKILPTQQCYSSPLLHFGSAATGARPKSLAVYIPPALTLPPTILRSCCEMENSYWLESRGTSLVVQMVKRLSTRWETWVRALGWENPLEKEMAIHSSTIAWKIPWTEEPGGLQSMGWKRVGHDWVTSLSFLSQRAKSSFRLVPAFVNAFWGSSEVPWLG